MKTKEEARWHVRSTQTQLSNPWFSVVQQQILLPDDSTRNCHFVHFPRPAVGIIPRHDGAILLIHQYRVTIDEYVWAIPSGGVDEGEEVERAARRELLEETGYEAPDLRHLVSYNPSYGSTDQRFELFLADNPRKVTEIFDRGEVIEHRWFSEDEVLQMILQNEIVDGLSLTPLALLFLEEALQEEDRSRSSQVSSHSRERVDRGAR